MIYTGTAGYSYKDWIGPFYPEGIKASDMLDYYTKHFKFTELNSSFYHMPGLRLFEGIDRKTPEDFKFSVKLFGGFTHERNLGREDAQKFIYSLGPLLQKGKLVCILAQFPYSFHYNTDNMDYLKKLREWFSDVEVNIEFRNREWINQTVINILREENLGYVCLDEPNIKGLIGDVAISSSNVSYIRFHGKNSDKWYSGKGSERYDYLYSNSELENWIPKILKLDNDSNYTLISFNNHPMGKAVENAKAVGRLLQNR
jgi:uncharacterized protein YecE (DUF72 family)